VHLSEDGSLPTETSQTALEQTALDFIRTHARTTRDAAEVLSTA
jgi:hypothetical protein